VKLNKLPPWLEAANNRLGLLIKDKRIPHSILLSGGVGIGKSILAGKFVKILLCPSGQLVACEHCKSCRMYDQRVHGDFLPISLEDKTVIGVDQIRKAISFSGKTNVFSGRKVILINPASNLHHGASNALLKSLEEPPPNTVLILVSSRDESLPATVRSRCHRVALESPDYETALKWLSDLLPDCDDFSKDVALGMRYPIGAAMLLQTEEFNSLMQIINNSLLTDSICIENLKKLFSDNKPDRLMLECITVLIERSLRKADTSELKRQESTNLFFCHEGLRNIINKIDNGLALNLELNINTLLTNINNFVR